MFNLADRIGDKNQLEQSYMLFVDCRFKNNNHNNFSHRNIATDFKELDYY